MAIDRVTRRLVQRHSGGVQPIWVSRPCCVSTTGGTRTTGDQALPDQQITRKNVVRVDQVVLRVLQRPADASKPPDIGAPALLDTVDQQHIHNQAAPAQRSDLLFNEDAGHRRSRGGIHVGDGQNAKRAILARLR